MTDDMKESEWPKLSYEERERRLNESRKQADDAFYFGVFVICLIMLVFIIYGVVVEVKDWIG